MHIRLNHKISEENKRNVGRQAGNRQAGSRKVGICRQTIRKIESIRQAGRKTGKQTGRQEAGRHTGKEKGRQFQSDRQTGR